MINASTCLEQLHAVLQHQRGAALHGPYRSERCLELQLCAGPLQVWWERWLEARLSWDVLWGLANEVSSAPDQACWLRDKP